MHNQAIQNILCHFNFERVHKAMLALDWGWASGPPYDITHIPDLVEIKESALSQLNYTARKCEENGREFHCGTGGFEVSAYPDGSMSLKFVVEDWEADKAEED